jgi:hypothetical protein
VINPPLTIEKDAFYDTKTTCFALRSIIAFIHSNGDNLPLTNNKRSLYAFTTDHDAHHGEVVVVSAPLRCCLTLSASVSTT